jgi:hypothetical protein
MIKFPVLYVFFLQVPGLSIAQAINIHLRNADSLASTWNFRCRLVETEAGFQTGIQDWNRYIRAHLNYNIPANNGAAPGKYTVTIRYIVSREGKLTNITAATNLGFGMEQEAIRVIRSSPDWIPATRNGRVVKFYRYDDITFVVCGITESTGGISTTR